MIPFKNGERVIVTGGAWSGYSGEYAGTEETPVGILHRVNLDAGGSTLVPLVSIRSLSPDRKKRIRRALRSQAEKFAKEFPDYYKNTDGWT